MKLSANFVRAEFDCKCGCGFDTVDIKLVEVLQGIVDYWKQMEMTEVRCVISGPNRCEARNTSEGGARNSGHLYGRAADFRLYIWRNGGWKQVEPKKVFNYLAGKYKMNIGIGLYRDRVHVDTMTGKKRIWRD